jgi:hypothetical protein
VARAREEADKIHRLYHREVLVETVTSVPEEHRRDLHNRTRAGASQFFANWARERAEAAGVSGLYVLICTDPRFVQVTAYPADQEVVFTEARHEDVRKMLVQRLPAAGGERSLLRRLLGRKPRPEDADEALLDVFRKAREALQATFPDVEKKTDPAAIRDAALAAVALGLVGVWLVLAVVRRKLARREGRPAGDDPAAHLAGLLGGTFGTPAGLWGYDRLLRGAAGAAPPGDALADVMPPRPADAAEGTANGEPAAAPDGGLDRPLHEPGEPPGPARVTPDDRPA